MERFVFVSAAGLTDLMVGLSPFPGAKRQTERTLRASELRAVLVQPGPFQETWTSPEAGIWPGRRRAVVFGRGQSPWSYVAMDDVAEACVRLSTMADPPEAIELGGPEELTRHEVLDAFERAYGGRFRRLSVPRAVLEVGARGLRRGGQNSHRSSDWCSCATSRGSACRRSRCAAWAWSRSRCPGASRRWLRPPSLGRAAQPGAERLPAASPTHSERKGALACPDAVSLTPPSETIPAPRDARCQGRCGRPGYRTGRVAPLVCGHGEPGPRRRQVDAMRSRIARVSCSGACSGIQCVMPGSSTNR